MDSQTTIELASPPMQDGDEAVRHPTQLPYAIYGYLTNAPSS